MMKITFDRRRPLIDDWAVRANGIAYGSLWRAGAEYLTNCTHLERFPTMEAAQRAARRQLKAALQASKTAA